MKPREIIVKTAITGVVKIAAALVAFFMTLLITRNLTTDDSGLVLLAITFLTVSSIVFRFGLDNIVLRKISAEFEESTGRGVLLTGIIWISLISVPVSVLASFNSDLIAVGIFNKEDFSTVFKIAVLSLPAISIFMLFSKAFQGIHRVIISVFLLNLGISLLFIILFFLTFSIANWKIDPENCVMLYVISAYIVLFVSIILWNKYCKGSWGKVDIYNREMARGSSNLWLASISVLAVQWSSVLIAGAYIDSSEFAQLSAAQRTASLVSFILMIVNMVVAPRFAVLWKNKNFSEMKKLAKWSARGCLLISTPLVLFIYFKSDYIMTLFGENYSNGGILLSILAVGQYLNVITGSVGYLLTMSGHEKDYRRITITVGPLTVALSYFLIVDFGAVGAAFAATIGLSVQNISALFLVRKRLGFFPIG